MNSRHAHEVENRAIKRIAIAGHGFEAWLATNYILAAFGSKNIQIQVCPAYGSDALDELYAILAQGPDTDLADIGISSNILARHCGASFSLGARVAGRAKPYGNIGANFLGLPFHHHWLRAFPGQKSTGYFNWSPATLAMQRNTFAPPVKSSGYGMAHHADISLFTRFLRERAIRSGVTVPHGSLLSVIRKNGSDRIGGLQCNSGEVLEADLYVDCSGPAQAMIGGASSYEWVQANGLSGFRLQTSRSRNTTSIPVFHTLEATDEGWDLEIPGSGWASRITLSNAPPHEKCLEFSPGHLTSPWIENCVAIGTASANILPVEPIQFRLFSRSIKRMLDLLPGRDCCPSETAEYNHFNRTEVEELHDLTCSYELARTHSKLSLANQDLNSVHESLGSRLKLFSRRGKYMPGDSDLLEPGDWAATLILLGMVPEKHDRLIERLPIETLKSYLNELQRQIEHAASEFPPHDVYLNAVKSSRQAPTRAAHKP